MLSILHQIFYGLIQALQPFLVPTCFVLAWLLVGSLLWTLTSATRAVVRSAKTLHSIPCAQCQFFTNTHYLKCPVHPSKALSSEAINCPDYQRARG